jgi:hypothetical protein
MTPPVTNSSGAHDSALLAHRGAIRTAAGKLDVGRLWKQAISLPADALHDGFGEFALQELD